MKLKILDWLSEALDRRAEAPPPLIVKRREPQSPYHAVSIRPGVESCGAAQRLGNMRFLSSKAPALPLPECNFSPCTCRYAHYSDRRSGFDRRRVLGEPPSVAVGERRANFGRRSTDARATWDDPRTSL